MKLLLCKLCFTLSRIFCLELYLHPYHTEWQAVLGVLSVLFVRPAKRSEKRCQEHKSLIQSENDLKPGTTTDKGGVMDAVGLELNCTMLFPCSVSFFPCMLWLLVSSLSDLKEKTEMWVKCFNDQSLYMEKSTAVFVFNNWLILIKQALKTQK